MSKLPTSAILHYSAPPVIGGVEAVLQAHTALLAQAGYPVSVVAGRGEAGSLPALSRFVSIPEMDSQHPQIAALSRELEQGILPKAFPASAERLAFALAPVLDPVDVIFVHNILTKHFNLPLTSALHRLMDSLPGKHWVAWSHDLSWTSPSSRPKLHPGYPWDLLRTYRPGMTYVAVSEQRQQEIATLFGIPPESIQVIYNGVEPGILLGLSPEGQDLVQRLDLLDAGLVVLMPVRVTEAKNIEFALRVAAALKAQGCHPKFIVTGPPDPHAAGSAGYFQGLQDLRRSLGVEKELRFVYESGPDSQQGYTISSQVVGDLFRVADLMFMPSHREGFGMPVLEAALAGVQVVSAAVPASREIGGEEVIEFDLQESPESVAHKIRAWAEASSTYKLRSRVRQNYTWQAIFKRQIEPLLSQGAGR